MLRVILCVLLLPVSTAIATDFELDHGIGFSARNDIEDWVDTKESRRSTNNYDYSRLRESTLASSYGNSIVIQTEPGSHVVLNASQINTGNQNAEVTLNNLDGDRYENVEIPEYNTENRLYYSK